MAHEVPPQVEFLYNGIWNAEIDDILLCNLINEKPKFPVGEDYIPAQGLLMATETSSDDEEIISPMCASYSASRRLFDEDSGDSPIAGVYGSVPPPNFFPRKPIDLKDSPFKGNNSTSSSSNMKWWNKS